MTGINPQQLLAYVIRPTLAVLGLGGQAAEELMLGTALQESGGGRYLHQLGTGPAVGIFEMEPNTLNDIQNSFLVNEPYLADKVASLKISGLSDVEQMAGNLYYACAMARLLYYRIHEPLPKAGDIAAQAGYYKKYYNTPLGAATVGEYIANWNNAIRSAS